MNRSHLWKFLFVVFVIGWSVYELYPPTGRPLIEVFQEKAYKRDAGYTNILQEFSKLEAARPANTFANLKQSIGTNDLTKYFPEYDVKGERDPNNYILNQLQRAASGKIKLGLDLQGGSSFVVEMKTNKLAETASSEIALANAVEVLRKRVDKFGVAEPLLQMVPGQNRIVIQMPGLSEAENESVRKVIQQSAFLEFRMVHDDSDRLLKEGIIPPGFQLMKETRTTQTGEKTIVPFLVSKKRVEGLTGKNVKSAGVIRGNLNDPQIAFRFDTEGAATFARITKENVGKQLAIILDGELYSAPVIRNPILDGSGVISGGNMTEGDAFTLANVLQNPLEAPVEIVNERTVDPSLGADSIRTGVEASIVGAVATFVFMLVFYFFGGLVANLALMLNVLILLGVMAQLGATLTLPGIAGIALTIGMAVDANVLIFERMREEMDAGKSLRGAVTAGYGKAFGTILDSNITTLISSIILIYMGTGPVKGFGVTLTIGVCASMFTALLVTRLVFDFLIARGFIKRVRMLPMIKGTKIDFLRWGKLAFIGSWILIILGVGYGLYRGKNVLGVDFAGGDQLTLRFKQKVEVDDLRKAAEKGGVGDTLIQYQRSLAEARETLQIVGPFNSGEKIAQSLKTAFPQAAFEVAGIEKVGPSVGAEIQRSAVIASLLALVGILVYVSFRYELSFAVGAVVAVIHDVALTMGLFFVSQRQMSAPMVAAILTIIGYSINDKIVILDRIREDLKLGVRGSFRELINIALNQTLSRTLITGGSVMLATLALYVFGGGVIQDFAFTFLVGIIAGTYSSIFIASPIVLWWNKGERPKIGAQVLMETSGAKPEVAGGRARGIAAP